MPCFVERPSKALGYLRDLSAKSEGKSVDEAKAPQHDLIGIKSRAAAGPAGPFPPLVPSRGRTASCRSLATPSAPVPRVYGCLCSWRMPFQFEELQKGLCAEDERMKDCERATIVSNCSWQVVPGWKFCIP